MTHLFNVLVILKNCGRTKLNKPILKLLFCIWVKEMMMTKIKTKIANLLLLLFLVEKG